MIAPKSAIFFQNTASSLHLRPLSSLFQGDREYRLPPLAGCKIAFAMVGVTQRTREIMHDCAKQCGATILDDVDEK